MNSLDEGKAIEIDAGPEHRWIYHHDASVDAAVCELEAPEEEYVQGRCIYGHTVVDDYEMRHRYGVGDEVFMTGLFAPLTGNASNLPIVRLGNLAMMPGEERIPVERHRRRGYVVDDVEGYLIEARSIGGLSGSPCFIRGTVQAEDLSLRPVQRGEPIPPQVIRPVGVDDTFKLFGLVHGHWDLPPEHKNDEIDASGKKSQAVNMGIAIVVPVRKILEILNRPELQSRRRARAEAGRRPATPDIE